VEEPFVVFLQKFQAEAQLRGHFIETNSISIRNGEIAGSNHEIALCITYVPANLLESIAERRSDWRKVIGHRKSPEVIVPTDIWNLLSKNQKEIAIFHELGHCLLNLDHQDDIPAIMNPVILPEEYYKFNRTKLLDELFATYFDRKIPLPQPPLQR
jgi:hypothetical protein